ncbi:SGNH/GDSL hydrolase family protein [Nocardioides ochotonae]|uniref:SGNH/GDSL hydrolase family protein n=1 Tax=Nocardioides ochotonae TaxID=2685869 RepID=UPI00140E1631|nr:SGNH/GDSL hydrolase family protein [Nocardioides ochotonae]
MTSHRRPPRTLTTPVLGPVLGPVLTAALMTGLLAGCSDSASRGEKLAERAPTPTATPTLPVEREESAQIGSYVALGDSFTAAPLVTAPADDDGCLRSTNNYPTLVAEALGADLEDRSCGGAETGNLTAPQRTFAGTVPAQLGALDADTDLVTMGIGGNDFGVFATLVRCAELGVDDPDGAPCTERFGDAGAAELDQQLATIGERLTASIEKVRRRAPDAEIVVVGYPRVIPPAASCPELLPLASGDRDLVAGLNRRLAAVQRQVARETDVRHVDLYAASASHDVCSEEPWVNGRATVPGHALAYHPLATGQRAAARLVLDAVEQD